MSDEGKHAEPWLQPTARLSLGVRPINELLKVRIINDNALKLPNSEHVIVIASEESLNRVSRPERA